MYLEFIPYIQKNVSFYAVCVSSYTVNYKHKYQDVHIVSQFPTVIQCNIQIIEVMHYEDLLKSILETERKHTVVDLSMNTEGKTLNRISLCFLSTNLITVTQFFP